MRYISAATSSKILARRQPGFAFFLVATKIYSQKTASHLKRNRLRTVGYFFDEGILPYFKAKNGRMCVIYYALGISSPALISLADENRIRYGFLRYISAATSSKILARRQPGFAFFLVATKIYSQKTASHLKRNRLRTVGYFFDEGILPYFKAKNVRMCVIYCALGISSLALISLADERRTRYGFLRYISAATSSKILARLKQSTAS